MSTDSKSFVQGVFRTLYAEHPEHWGNGLSFNNFSPANGESVYLVRTKEASTPIGFVGWQNRHEGGKSIGYYSVGLLPEFRGQGYAKAAVAKIIAEKSAGVDEVRALIHHSNTASLHLAESLGIPVTKSAMLSALIKSPITQRLLRTAAGGAAGAGTAYGVDTLTGADKTMNNEALRSQLITTGILGAMGAQPGAGAVLKNFINPKRSIGGTNTLTNLLRPGQRIAPTIGRELSAARALSLAALPSAAIGAPMVVGNARKPIHEVFNDFTNSYGKEVENTGQDPGPFGYLARRVGSAVGERLKPTVSELGDKAISAGKEVAGKGIQSGIEAGKPMLSDFAREIAKPIAGSLVGSGLGYAAGNLFQKDDPNLTPEERMARHDRQRNIKMLLSLAGGAAGTFAPAAIESLSKKAMNKQAAALLARAGKVVGPKIIAMLKNKGVQMAGGAGAGAGLSAYENEKLFPEADTKLKAINILSGALTGAALPSHPVGASTTLTGKQLGLLGLDTYMKDAPMRQNIANTQLSAAQAARDTAGTEQSTAKLLMEKAKNLSNTDKALYGVAGAGLLGAGIYGANSLFGGKKKAPAVGSVADGPSKNKAPGKIRFDIPSDAMPPEFFQGLMKAEESGKGRAKYACFATRNELLQEIEKDLA
jgi:hypothetical protein